MHFRRKHGSKRHAATAIKISKGSGVTLRIAARSTTEFLLNYTDEAVRVVKRLVELDRAAIRQRFEKRFWAPRMARD